MTRIVHLSDPHFGTEPATLPGRLLDCLAALRPDGIVLSGDVTQRGLASQYRAARRFISDLPAPVIVVPGNHDAPLWNLALRIVDPWRTWRAQLGLPLQATLRLKGAVIVALNSANPWVWKDGRVSAAQVDGLRAAFDGAAGRRIVVLHHPPQPPEGERPSLSGAARLTEVCAELGVEMILSGHLHFTHIAPLAGASRILGVQAGTCLSSRIRREGNAFTLLDLTERGVTVQPFRLDAAGVFRPDAARDWLRGAGGWR